MSDNKKIKKLKQGVVIGVHEYFSTKKVSFNCDEATYELIKDYENNDSACCGNGCGTECKG